jgi:hypothetical protein
MGTVQEVVETLQFADSVVYVVPSLWRIATVYAVIAEPPLEGATQLIVTLTFVFTAVVGAAGTLGMAAALMATSDESVPKPTRLRAVTLNV